MMEHEVLWECLRSMHFSQQKYRKKLMVDQFLMKMIEGLSADLSADPFTVLFKQIQNHLVNTEVFILHQQNYEYAKVFRSTVSSEEGHLWPLIGPFRRSTQSSGSIVFNTKLIPVLSNFTPVSNYEMISMVISGFCWGQERFILVTSRSEVGGFDHNDQDLICSVTRLLSIQEDRFKLGVNHKKSEIDQLIKQPPEQAIDHSEATTIERIEFSLSSDDLSLSQEKAKEEATNWLIVSEAEVDDGFCLAQRYQFKRKLGQGGQAVVYQAFDQLLNRSVAIKLMMQQRVPKQKTFEAAIREASLAANISHPSVVKIYDIGFISNHQQPYIVMEYLDGHDLKKVINQYGKLPVSKVLSLFIPVLNALGEAHQLGLVHRDLKPHNLLLSNSGSMGDRLKVLDFGLAQFTKKRNADDELSGTLAYLAPEYLKDRIIGPQIDVYQIGLIMIEAITGQKIFCHESSYVTMLGICDGAWELDSTIKDSELGRVLLQATAVDHTLRYQNGSEFSQALSSLAPEKIRQLEWNLENAGGLESS